MCVLCIDTLEVLLILLPCNFPELENPRHLMIFIHYGIQTTEILRCDWLSECDHSLKNVAL